MSDGIYSSLLGNCKELRRAQPEEKKKTEGLNERDGAERWEREGWRKEENREVRTENH